MNVGPMPHESSFFTKLGFLEPYCAHSELKGMAPVHNRLIAACLGHAVPTCPVF